MLGSTGMIGHQVYNHLNLENEYHLYDISYRNKLTKNTILLDVREEQALIRLVKGINPQFIINCIGTLVEESKENPELADYTNAQLPPKLERLADQIEAKLIHMSTDCVFSGYKTEPYIENDQKDGLDTYAKTKGRGEIINERHLTLRTSVVGPELKKDGAQLFNWFMSESNEINGFADAIWSGVTSLELAKAVKWAITNQITGLYHITNGFPISKNKLLHLFKRYTKKDIEIKAIRGININKHFIDTRKLINYSIPSYEEMISKMIEKIRGDYSKYPHYSLK